MKFNKKVPSTFAFSILISLSAHAAPALNKDNKSFVFGEGHRPMKVDIVPSSPEEEKPYVFGQSLEPDLKRIRTEAFSTKEKGLFRKYRIQAQAWSSMAFAVRYYPPTGSAKLKGSFIQAPASDNGHETYIANFRVVAAGNEETGSATQNQVDSDGRTYVQTSALKLDPLKDHEQGTTGYIHADVFVPDSMELVPLPIRRKLIGVPTISWEEEVLE